MTRPTWDEIWLEMADAMAKRSRCPTGVGCVIVDAQQRVVGTGYPGPPATYDLGEHEDAETCEVYCPQRALTAAGEYDPSYSQCPSVHAEINALITSDRSRVEGGTMYVSTATCKLCMKAVGNSGVRRVVWNASDADEYRGADVVITYLERCGITVNVIG